MLQTTVRGGTTERNGSDGGATVWRNFRCLQAYKNSFDLFDPRLLLICPLFCLFSIQPDTEKQENNNYIVRNNNNNNG